MVWDFFENMDEMVYVSDMETDKLVYMNRHLRQALGDERWIGKHCYEVLQGRKSPCQFCNNHELSEGEFMSWTYQNPVLKKRFLIKDSVVVWQGRKYRIEIAIDADAGKLISSSVYHTRYEAILSECLQYSFSSTHPEESVKKMLAYIGKTFDCDRVYIFEFGNMQNAVNNTYEWCAKNVVPQKDVLQNVAVSGIDWWMDMFAENQVAVIRDLEEIRLQYPEAYAVLKPQDIHMLAAGPIKIEGKIIGFIGVDNPDEQKLSIIEMLLKVIGYFAASFLIRRDILNKLNELSYHDQLTGALNRHALAQYYERMPMKTAGVIFCDLTGLKNINDSLGHEAGDRMLCYCYRMIRDTVDTGLIYRTGGDEFLILCPDCTEGEFLESVKALQEAVRNGEQHMALGFSWSEEAPLNLETLVLRADQVMYAEKRKYYQRYLERIGSYYGEARREKMALVQAESSFQNFMKTAYFNAEALFCSVSENNDSSYFYFGDMQKNIFYISDNMRDDFGFRDNIVRDLLALWIKRISTPEFRKMYCEDIEDMLIRKRSIHDLRYMVRDRLGNDMWIRCYGQILWDDRRENPLFFSGRISCQDTKFVVDPITNFPRENAAFAELNKWKQSGDKALLIGIALNGMTELNALRGRYFGDRLLGKVSAAMLEHLSRSMSFYRLEGARYMAVVHPACPESSIKGQLQKIEEQIRRIYEEMDISVSKVCYFGVIRYPCEHESPKDIIGNLVQLLRLAKKKTDQFYVEYAAENISRIKETSQKVLCLGKDVCCNMRNFRIVVQPMVHADTGRIVGGEALLRWNYNGCDIAPGIFIPLLEKNHSIYEAGRWVFEQAAATCAKIRVYEPEFFMTFNVSLYQLSDEKFLPFMKQTLQQYSLDGSALIAELTESSLDEQPEQLKNFIEACQSMGVRIAMDDFGSGYSSLRMLLQYPSSIIKLDRSLIRESMEAREKQQFIRIIVFACHQFGKTVCIEGVEKEAQNEIARKMGCDMVQGFYHYHPMELRNLYRLIAKTHADDH